MVPSWPRGLTPHLSFLQSSYIYFLVRRHEMQLLMVQDCSHLLSCVNSANGCSRHISGNCFSSPPRPLEVRLSSPTKVVKAVLSLLLPLCKRNISHGASIKHTPDKETLNQSPHLGCRGRLRLPAAIRWQIFLLGNNIFLWFPERLNIKPKTMDSDEIQKNYLCVFWKRVNKCCVLSRYTRHCLDSCAAHSKVLPANGLAVRMPGSCKVPIKLWTLYIPYKLYSSTDMARVINQTQQKGWIFQCIPTTDAEHTPVRITWKTCIRCCNNTKRSLWITFAKGQSWWR